MELQSLIELLNIWKKKNKKIEENKNNKNNKRRTTFKKIHIKDGSVICIKDMKIDSGIVDDFAISPEAAQIFIENNSGTPGNVAKRREVPLTIRVADDDEYESDDD